VLGRRFLILVAVLMGLTALAASVAPRQPAREDGREATPTPAAASGEPTVVTLEKNLAIDDGDDQRVTVTEGDLVQLTVSGDVKDAVKVLERIDSVDPTTPARFSLLAGAPGEFPIELLEAERQVGTLVIRAEDG
jgi:hypothetical protein